MRGLKALVAIGAASLMTTVMGQSDDKEIKIGIVASLSGMYEIGGHQLQNGINTYLKQNDGKLAGHKVTLIYRDTAGPNPDIAKRVAQELITRDMVDFLAGFDFTPGAMAVAPIATQAKTPMILMNASASIIPTKSPYIVRTSFTPGQTSYPLGKWAAQNGIKSVAIVSADFAPAAEAAIWFKKSFIEAGGKIVSEVAVPLTNVDFAPYLQKVKDQKPDAVFSFLPVGEPVILFYKTFKERGLAKEGIKLISAEGWVDDDVLKASGDAAIGAISSGYYTPSHDSKKNKDFIATYKLVSGGKMEPNYLAVGAYDGMAVIAEAVKKVGLPEDRIKLIDAMKGLTIDSPRGPLTIDPTSRDSINTVYMRKIEIIKGKAVAVEFDKFDAVKDPGKLSP
ncbi:ABC transporter substrate-binding protein [Herminiimonas contaminans]|uniref:ABC transporter substrate-binding protein n=1 Tax=Herminiimonas contaminans TaxID=1111140 RepID=A0ABS0ETM6_9BURK|nr:ABC transporter substrate-binding protein [Herminiimonas contaminans]MBF8178210.1 ABC transporter substrate-binding protein [Herminiimonas contaminans]